MNNRTVGGAFRRRVGWEERPPLRATAGRHRRRRSAPLLLAAVSLWGGLAAEVAGEGSPATDRAALEALYDATGGPTWTDSTNWKTVAPLGEWYGVTTDAAGRVTELSLHRNDLTGSVPGAVGELVNLQVLWLGENELTGGLPAELRRLSNLEVLDLARNELTGPVPAWLGDLVQLRRLRLGWNGLTGGLPTELRRLSNLQTLYLDGNELTGPVPGWLGDLIQLRWLSLGENELTGPIPPELALDAAHQVLDVVRRAQGTFERPRQGGRQQPIPRARCDRVVADHATAPKPVLPESQCAGSDGQVPDRKPQGPGRIRHAGVVRRELDRLPLPAQEVDGGEVQRIEGADRNRESGQRACDHRRRQLQQRDSSDERLDGLAVRVEELARVHPGPDLVLDEAAGD